MYQELGGVRACSTGILGLNLWSSVGAFPAAEEELTIVRFGKGHRFWKRMWEFLELNLDLDDDDEESGTLKMIAMMDEPLSDKFCTRFLADCVSTPFIFLPLYFSSFVSFIYLFIL